MNPTNYKLTMSTYFLQIQDSFYKYNYIIYIIIMAFSPIIYMFFAPKTYILLIMFYFLLPISQICALYNFNSNMANFRKLGNYRVLKIDSTKKIIIDNELVNFENIENVKFTLKKCPSTLGIKLLENTIINGEIVLNLKNNENKIINIQIKKNAVSILNNLRKNNITVFE